MLDADPHSHPGPICGPRLRNSTASSVGLLPLLRLSMPQSQLRNYVMRDLFDAVTMHPPAGFSLRLLNPAPDPAAPAPYAGAAPHPGSADAAEGAPSSPPSSQAAAAAQPGSSHGGSPADENRDDGLSRPSPGNGDDAVTAAEVAAAVVEEDEDAPKSRDQV